MLDQSGQSTAKPTTDDERAWTIAATAVVAGIAAIILLFRGGVAQVVALWNATSAYNHCWIVLPISLYLIYERRRAVSVLRPVPTAWGLVAVAGSAAVWLLGDLVGVAEVGHFAIMGLIQGLLLTVLGWEVYRALLFPLMFLWFMVPTGGALLGPLQSIATGMSSGLLVLSGIPTVVDGNAIEVPTGRYIVVEGCAGLNFVLASLMLSVLYGHSIYRGWVKPAMLVALMVPLAIVANGIRIWGIIAIAQFTERRIDIGDDHLWYGWMFFSVVLMAAMGIAYLFRDPPADLPPPRSIAPDRSRFKPAVVASAVVATVAVAAAAPAYAALLRAGDEMPEALALHLPTRMGPWRLATPSGWSPHYPNAHIAAHEAFTHEGRTVDLFVAYYWRQDKGHKAIGSANRLTPVPEWIQHPLGMVPTRVGGEPSWARATLLDDDGRRWVVWSWYWVGGRYTANPMTAMLLQLKATLTGGDRRAALVAVWVAEAEGAHALGRFLEDALILSALTSVAAGK